MMNRRQFTQLSTLAIAGSRFEASVSQASSSQRLGIAPVGLGTIAGVFMDAVGKTTNARLAGFVTGHPEEKGKKFAAQYGVPESAIYTYGTMKQIRDNREIGAVYIALPNSMHCEYTVKAAEAGKHVLCEKPMAISVTECRRMIDACKQAKVKLMIAYRIHFDATFLHVREKVQSGELGEVEAFLGGFYGLKNKQEWRLKRAMAGGGSLMDLGIYPLNAIRWILSEEPTELRAMVATRDKTGAFREVEQSVEWIMKFPSGVLASCGSSYGQSGTNFLQINGSAGHLRVEPAFVYGDAVLKLSGRSKTGEITGGGPVNNPDQFVSETSHFADCVLKDKPVATPGEEGLADLQAIEAIYGAAAAPIA